MNKKNIKTQKAKGIMFGIKCLYRSYPSLYINFHDIDHKLITKERQIGKITNKYYFGRPCPIKPRHGFVDSKLVRNHKQIKNLFDEMKTHDPNGELLLGKFFKKVDYNSILVSSGLVSVGKGNDGATSGKDSISFPISPLNINKLVRQASGLKKQDTIYIESIITNNINNIKRNYLAQIRGGPKANTAFEDFIPKDIQVTSIVSPNSDLLSWEKLVKTFSKGTVVYGNGHTLASHAAIHCILNNITFITTFKPKVGATIKRNKLKKHKLNRDLFKKGVKAGLNISKNYCNNLHDIFVYTLSVLHNWAYLKNSPHASWILGSASILWAKVCTALVCGEYRHKSSILVGSRNSIYKDAMDSSISVFYKLPKMFKDFYSIEWEDGYGGIPWAICAWYSNCIWKETVNAFNKKSTNLTDNEILKLMGSINKVTNLAHNNGWWFNKIASKKEFNFIAQEPALALFSKSYIYYEIYKKTKEIKNLNKDFKNLKTIPNKPFAIDKGGDIILAHLVGITHTGIYVTKHNGTRNSRLRFYKLPVSVVNIIKRKYEKVSYPNILKVSNGKFKINGYHKYINFKDTL